MDTSPSAVQAAHDLRVGVGRLRRRFREVTDRRELTPSQVSVLSRLGKDGPSSASAIAAAERVRPQSAASWLGALEERGLVERHQDPTDGRRQVVSLSDGGREFLEDTRRSGEQWLARALQERFTEEERRTVIEAMSLLERLIEV
ncbi:MarR family winged helix-turn-helix transcriptional regulator [Pseudonocardia endophytica]|uniref:DNA-binding MarR family transcriptional regulator n=1 Tax=Pseudonocardia endophytica TaxID=401976 RepID=A0A4R1HME6_PSEEN|nr:MarR family transcriptional regulator [Pseudonocardia endophytica]TCK20829.1 DNA-binding MarR family transcriptional regulator [Pseudonocardia endophytica]